MSPNLIRMHFHILLSIETNCYDDDQSKKMFEIKKMHYLSLLSCSDDQENFAKLKSRFNDFAKVTILRIGGDKKTRIRDQDMSASFFLLQNFEQQQQKRNKPS